VFLWSGLTQWLAETSNWITRSLELLLVLPLLLLLLLLFPMLPLLPLLPLLLRLLQLLRLLRLLHLLRLLLRLLNLVMSYSSCSKIRAHVVCLCKFILQMQKISLTLLQLRRTRPNGQLIKRSWACIMLLEVVARQRTFS